MRRRAGGDENDFSFDDFFTDGVGDRDLSRRDEARIPGESVDGVAAKILVDAPPFADPPPVTRLVYWTRPELVCRVRFSEWSKDGYLRFPIFNALRPDLDPRECVLE